MMGGNPHFDDVDRELVTILHRDGRASFRAVASELDISEQAVARRFHRLATSGLLRVTALPAPHALGVVHLILRMRAEGGTASRVAAAVAARVDTPWVDMLAGQADLTFTTHTRPDGGDIAGLLDALSRTTGVRELIPSFVLRIFTSPASWFDQTPALDAFDHRLIAALQVDARANYSDLAARLATTAPTVRRRLDRLREQHILDIVTEYPLALVGYPIETMIWISVAPGAIETVGSALAADPRVRFAASITGPANLMVATYHRDTSDLYRMQTNTLGGLDGIQHFEITPIVRTVKRHGLLRNGSLISSEQR
ncbi:Lrp/AsnC family transcriptional regulator [Nocardia sp. NPDC052566]|uniref:Lrp/AsnC family transcriptional regulator n=1 Tax=Nocardia sp. NPDC052566 TaxID=3364330 RepID=UPI0037CCBCD3